MTSFTDTDAIEMARRVASAELALPSRFAHGALLAAAVAMTVVVLSLLLTEPVLPARTRLAFALMTAIGTGWSVYAGWVLARRRTLLGRQRVVAGWLALVFTSLFTAGGFWIGIAGSVPAGLAAGGMGLALVAIALSLLLKAYRRKADLEKRLRQLEAQRPGGRP